MTEDKLDEIVGEVQEALQDVADALGAFQAAQPGEQGIPPVLASLTEHLHLRGCEEKPSKKVFSEKEGNNADQVATVLAALLL